MEELAARINDGLGAKAYRPICCSAPIMSLRKFFGFFEPPTSAT